MIEKEEQSKKENMQFISEIRVRFNETDALGIVWHGNYIKYFEDGREAFCRENQISYLDVQKNGLATPIIKSVCEHKLPLKYGDVAKIETTYIDSAAAKMIFRYRFFNDKNELVCIGETIQVFTTLEGELQLNIPDFILDWKRKKGLF